MTRQFPAVETVDAEIKIPVADAPYMSKVISLNDDDDQVTVNDRNGDDLLIVPNDGDLVTNCP